MRILAPLLVLTLLGIVALRWAADPSRARERAWIEGSWDLATLRPDVKEQLVARLEDQLERDGDDTETRWFAARAWLKVGEIGRAIDAVWGDPGLAAAPGTAHRFGALMLRVLGFGDDERLRKPRLGATPAALVLAEGGDGEAAAWLDEAIRTRFDGAYLDLLYSTLLYRTRDGALRVADALRSRGQPVTDVIAALLAVGSDGYAERGTDLARLEEIVLRDADRKQQRLVWSTACLALGRSEDGRALDVLAGLHRRLSGATDDHDLNDAAVVAAGLLAGGRWSMLEALAPYLGNRGLRSGVRPWYAEAVRLRLMRGDPEAAEAWLAVWQSLQTQPDPRLAEHVAARLLLGDRPPPARLPVERILRPLQAEGSTAAMHAIAAAWRYRSGEVAGRDALLRVLRRLQAAGWPGQDLQVADRLWVGPALTVCRALHLYDPSPRP